MNFYVKSFLKLLIDSILYAFLIFLMISYNDYSVTANIIYLVLIGIGLRVVVRGLLRIYQELSPISGVMMIFKLGISTFFVYIIQYFVAYYLFDDYQLRELTNIMILPTLVMTETFLLMIYRYWRRVISSLTQKAKNKIRTIIIGAGEGAKYVLDEIANNKDLNNQVVGFVDDDIKKIGKYFRGYKVLGTSDDIEKILENENIQEIIISTPRYAPIKFAKILALGDKYHFVIKRLSVIGDKETSFKIKELSIDELLNREAVQFSPEEINDSIKDKVVLVTGAGGSIGSELSRQIFAANPKTLILFDIYENSTYDIQLELIAKSKKECHTEIITIIGSTYNASRVDNIFKKHQPDLIFHAAAYKHVPLMEDSPMEAIRTNVIGTYNVAKAATKYGSKKMVLVSTDKAVRPTNVMGATKRLAELVIQYFASISETSYSAVRFGNVLGSNGSVVPLFRRQIEKGGPVTVTHPEINRFFMTIPEAVSLILQSGVYANKGEIFILDMGKPVKIADLARKMIIQAGLRPDVDIAISYVGLRPGEKLYEELLLDTTEHIKTPNQKIFIEKSEKIRAIEQIVGNLSLILDSKNEDEIKKALAAIVDTYTIQS